MLCVYWRGLPKNENWFRIDVERHFEGIPRQHLKDIVSTKKPEFCAKTIKHVAKVSDQPKLHSSTLNHAEALEVHVKPQVHMLPDLKEIVHSEANAVATGGGIGTGIGTAIGSLVGLISGGPAGMAAGGTTGGAIGGAIGGIGSGIFNLIGEASKARQSYNDRPDTSKDMPMSNSSLKAIQF